MKQNDQKTKNNVTRKQNNMKKKWRQCDQDENHECNINQEQCDQFLQLGTSQWWSPPRSPLGWNQ